MSKKIKTFINTEEEIKSLQSDIALLREQLEDRSQKNIILKQEIQRVNTFFENSTEIAMRCDLNLFVTYISPTVKRLIGFEADKIIGKNLSDIIEKETFSIASKHFKQRIIDKDFGLHITESQIKNRNGELVWFEIRTTPVCDEAGNIIALQGTLFDIQERKEAELSLIHSEEQHRFIIENSPDLIFQIDQSGNVASINKRGLIPFGYTSDKPIVGKPFQLFVHPADRSKLIESVLEAIGNKSVEPRKQRFRLLKNHDGHIWVELNSRMIFDENGNYLKEIGIARDISGKIQDENCLKESEQLYRQIFEDNFAIQLVIDPETCIIVDANQAASEYYGYSIDNLKTMKCHEIFNDTKEDFDSMLESITNSKSLTFQATHRLASGYLKDVEMFLGPVKLRGKDFAHAIIHDISKRTKALKSLRLSEEKYRSLTNAMNEGLVTVDQNLVHTLVNDRYCEITGYQREELIGLPLPNLIDEKAIKIIKKNIQLRKSGGTAPYEIEIIKKSGQSVHLLVSPGPLYDNDQNYIGSFAILTDLTDSKMALLEHKQMEERIQRSQKNESLSVLAGGVAHDFNNLLTGILGNSSLVLMDLPDDSSVIPIVEQIQESAKRAADLSNQMLAFSGKGKFEIQTISITDFMAQTEVLISPSVPRNIQLTIVHKEQKVYLKGDLTQLKQIVMSLVTNSIEAIGEQKGKILITTGEEYISPSKNDYISDEKISGEYLFINIEDNGCGMSEETIKKVFDPFFTTKFFGRGLGLAASMGIVKSHNGAFRIESVPDEGSSFRILLPKLGITDVRKEHEVHDSKDTESLEDLHIKGTILIIDDERNVRNFATRVINKIGFSAITAIDGRDGIKVFDANKANIDVILLDLTMPNLSGTEVLKHVRKTNKKIKIIISSGYSKEMAEEQFKDQKYDKFLQKPYQPKELLNLIKSLFEENNGR